MDGKVAANLETLTGLMSSMKNVISDLNGTIKAFNSNTDNMSSAISSAEKNAESLNKALKGGQSSMDEYNDVLAKGLKKSEDSQTSMQDKIIRANRSIISRYGAFFSAREKQHVEHQKSILGKLRNYASEQAEIFHNLDSRRAKLLHAFDVTKDIFKTFFSFGNSLFKIFKSVGGAVLNVAKFLVTLPLKGLEAILDIAHSVREEFLAISQSFEDTQEMISGTSRQGMGLANLTSEVRGLGGAFLNVGSEAARTFGYGLQGQQAMISKTAEKINGLGTLANVYGDSYSANAILVERAMQSLGMSVEDNAFLVRQSMSEGIHPFQAFNRSIQASVAASKEFGIDQKQIARGMNELRKNVVEFSHISEPELASVVAQAAQLGIEAKELNAVFSKFTTFDQAAESAALLSQTFGMAVDAMDIIRAEDPMEIINQFREGMQQTGRDFRDLNRHEKALMSQYTGLSGEALQTAMSFQGVGLSYAELQKKMEESSPQAQLKAAVKEMSASIKEFMNVGKKLTSPFQAISEGMKDALLKNGRFQRSMMGLSNRMQRLYSGVLSKFLNAGLLDAIEGVVDAFAKLISDDAITSLIKVTREFGNFLTVVLSADSKPQEISNALDRLITSFTSSSFVRTLFTIGKSIVGNIASSIIKSLPAILTSIKDLLLYFNNNAVKAVNAGENSWFKTYILDSLDMVMADGQTVGSSIASLVMDILNELKNAIGTSGSIIREIFAPVGEAIGNGIVSGIGAMGIGIALGAAIIPGLTLMLTVSFTKYLKNKLPELMRRYFPKIDPTSGMPTPDPGNTPSRTPKRGGFLNKLGRFGRFGKTLLKASVPTALIAGGIEYATAGRDETQRARGNNLSAGAYNVGSTASSIAGYGGLAALVGGGLAAVAGAPFIATAAAVTGTVAAVAAGVSAISNGIGYLSETTEAEHNAARQEREAQSRNQEEIARVNNNSTEEIANLQRQLTEARSTARQQPIQINVTVENIMDGQKFSENMISRLLDGGDRYQLRTDEEDNLQLFSRDSLGNISPV